MCCVGSEVVCDFTSFEFFSYTIGSCTLWTTVPKWPSGFLVWQPGGGSNCELTFFKFFYAANSSSFSVQVSPLLFTVWHPFTAKPISGVKNDMADAVSLSVSQVLTLSARVTEVAWPCTRGSLEPWSRQSHPFIVGSFNMSFISKSPSGFLAVLPIQGSRCCFNKCRVAVQCISSLTELHYKHYWWASCHLVRCG